MARLRLVRHAILLLEYGDMTIITDHMDAINHCLETRDDLRAALADTGVNEEVIIPEDGEQIDLGIA